MKTKRLAYLIQISIFSAIAAVAMMFKFPVFFVPGIYKLDFSDAIVLISGFSLGPVAGILTQLIKILLSIAIKGSFSFGLGEFADFATGLALVWPSAMIYKKYRTFKGACISMAVAIISLTFFSALINYFILIPAYQNLFSLSEDTIVSMGRVLNPWIKDKFSFVLFATCPFNLLKGSLVCVITLILYKKLSTVIHKISELKNIF